MSLQSQTVRSLKKEVVLLCAFEKGTWWRDGTDGFWRYARLKNMPFFRVSRKGAENLVFYGMYLKDAMVGHNALEWDTELVNTQCH